MQQDTPPGDFEQPVVEPQAPPPPPRQPRLPTPYITNAIIFANIVVFIATIFVGGFDSLFSPSIDALLKVGANFGPLTAGGEYWRVASNMFVHIGIMHIAMNMWVLSDVGRTVEMLFGSWKFLVIYLLAGIAGALNSLFWSPMNVSAGASGAVFGAFGAMLVFFWIHRKRFPPQILQTHSQRVMILIMFNLLYGFSTPGIDNSAHIGGLIGGFLAGFCVIPPVPGRNQWRFMDLIRVTLLGAALFSFGKLDMQRIKHNPAVEAYHAEQAASGLLKSGKYKQAITVLSDLLSREKDNEKAYSFRALAYAALEQPAKAIDDCTQSLALDPRDKFILLLRGDNYQTLGNYPASLADFNKLIEIDPEMAQAWNDRAWNFIYTHRYKDAVNDAARAVNLNPKDPAYLDTLGVVYAYQKQYQKALDAFGRALEINPREAGIYYHRANVYSRMGQSDNAEKDYAEARKLGYKPRSR